MPRRVNLTILLGLIIIAVFSFGLSAAAQPGSEGDDERGAASGDGIGMPGGEPEGVGPLDPPEELKGLAQEMAEASAAEGAYKNALFEERQLNDKIVRTRQDLAGAEKGLEEAQGEFDAQASRMYKRGSSGFLNLLLGAENFQEFQDLAGLSMQLLNGQRDEVEKWRESKAALQQKKEELETQLEDRKAITAEEEAKFDAAQSALNEAQDRRDSLDPDAHEKIQAWEERQVERARELVGRLGAEPLAIQPEVPPQEEGSTEEPVTGTAGDEETQARFLADLTGETPAGTREAPIRDLATGVAEKQAEAERRAKEAAELTADEQEVRRDAEEQKTAAKEAKLALARAPGAEQPEAQTNADELERQAKLAAEEAAAKGGAAKEAADQALEKGADADKAKQNLFVVGKAAGQPPTVSGDRDGVVDAGTELVVHGNFSISPGSSVTFEDADGTRGTATDGGNAKIVKGSIDTTLTGSPDNVTGGDGQLSTDGLWLVDTSGIAPDSGGVAPGPDVTGAGELQYAPNTGAGGLQYAAPALGTGGLQYAPKTGAGGLQYGSKTGIGGLQYAPKTGAGELQYGPKTGVGGLQDAPKTGVVGGLQYTTPALGGTGSQSKPVTAGQPGGPQATASAPTSLGKAALAEGLKYVGQPYVHGGAAPGGFDCSGFTRWVYGVLGKVLPDSPAAQYGMGTPVPVGTPGALIFFSEDGSGTPTHVGLDMGDGTLLHASIFTGKVSITPINYITGLLGDRMP